MSDASLQPRPVYLNGRWVVTATAIDVVNPSTTQVFARVTTVDRAAVHQALADAEAAGPQWRALCGRDRGQWLNRLADALERRAADVAHAITCENGKPLAQSLGEVAMSVDHLRWFAGEAPRVYGRIVPQQAAHKRHLVLRTPVGVVAAISPWNFPLVLALRKVAPALAAGCPVVLKPASATPLSALALAEVAHEVGLPAGVFQLVVGPARAIGAEFLENPICRKITFTGSTEVGRELIRGAAQRVQKLSLELGGHAPVLVFADADLETAVKGTIVAKFRNSSQSCIAANRIYVERSIYGRFVEAFVAAVRALKVGDGLQEGVDVGPLINQEALDHALRQIEQARSAGAKVLCGGGRADCGAGFFLEPTVLDEPPADAQCMTDETFAPVAPICPFDDEREALRRANATRYGLAAYAFTRDLGRAWRVAEGLDAGTIAINDGAPSTSQCPFGGVKESGWGRELGAEGIDAFLDTKHISLGIEP